MNRENNFNVHAVNGAAIFAVVNQLQEPTSVERIIGIYMQKTGGAAPDAKAVARVLHDAVLKGLVVNIGGLYYAADRASSPSTETSQTTSSEVSSQLFTSEQDEIPSSENYPLDYDEFANIEASTSRRTVNEEVQKATSTMTQDNNVAANTALHPAEALQIEEDNNGSEKVPQTEVLTRDNCATTSRKPVNEEDKKVTTTYTMTEGINEEKSIECDPTEALQVEEDNNGSEKVGLLSSDPTEDPQSEDPHNFTGSDSVTTSGSIKRPHTHKDESEPKCRRRK